MVIVFSTSKLPFDSSRYLFLFRLMLFCLSINFKSVCPYTLDYFYNSCYCVGKVISALATVDCLFPSKLRFPWFFPHTVVFYFSFSRQLTQLGSGHKFPPASCGLWFQCQCNFQSVCSAVWICPLCAPPRSQSEIGTWSVLRCSVL